VNPPSPEQLGAPLLGLQYVIAALLERGFEVRVVDAAARYFDGGAEAVDAEVTEFEPQVVGVALFTRWVWHAYALVERLRGRVPLLVAGGAHTTVRPEETLEHGFDVAVVGEAEHTLPELVDRFGHGRSFAGLAGVVYRSEDGRIRRGPPAQPIGDLDVLAPPLLAQGTFDPRWYDPSGSRVVPGGVLTSRGCPARCTFCANYVTGRTFRYRSAEAVAKELNEYHEYCGLTFFPCWDDALTANRPRLYELCEAIEREVRFPFTWSAITRANMVNPDLLAAMRRAGLVHVNFGVESGDDEILRAIKKGIKTEHVVRALEWAKDAGLMTACNFMVGFPQETPRALARTLAFMQEIAPLVDTFSTLGVLVPFPGTPLYDDYHVEHGFTDWWLREEYSHYDPPPPVDDFDRFYRHYVDDANLELDFFHYTDELRGLMRDVMRFKAEHNLVKVGLLADPVYRAHPVAEVAAVA
jgi:anaerobic magnesium-protoporphyrin IX monomethyl ester cyclase